MRGHPHYDQSFLDWSWNGQLWCGGEFLQAYPSKDGAKEWDYKDHLAADFGGCDLFRKLAVSYIVTIAGGSRDLPKKW